MNKIPVGKIIEFSRRTDRGRSTLIRNLNTPKKKKSDNEASTGGDYWISCISALKNTFRTNDNNILKEKIEFLSKKKVITQHHKTVNRNKRNIEILQKYIDVDFSKWMPNTEFTILSKPKNISIISINGVLVEIKPSHVFTWFESGKPCIGAIWFLAKTDEFNINELSVFTETLYRYLKMNYSKEFEINTDLCVAVNTSNKTELSYSEFKQNKLPSYLSNILKEIRKIA